MGILKAKELNKTPVASARELKVLSGTSHGILKPLNMLLKKVSRVYEIKITFILMYVPCILYSLLSRPTNAFACLDNKLKFHCSS